MRVLLKLGLLSIALITPPVLCVGAVAAMVVSDDTSVASHRNDKFDPERCNWYCHNRDCYHDAELPSQLTGNDGAFGKTIELLAESGKATGLGYQGMNVLVFCVLWPIVTYFFYSIAVTRAIWRLL